MGEWVGRALKWYGVDVGSKPGLHLNDVQGLPEAPYIQIAVRAGVIKGYPDGTYGPDRTAARAEAAAIAVRFAKQLKKNPPEIQVFEQHHKNQFEVITAIEKEVAAGKLYNHSYLLEPYLSEMAIYGYGGYDISAHFVSERYWRQGYRELVSCYSEPILIRDTIAVTKSTFVIRRVRPDGTEVRRSEETFYVYFAKRNGAWVGTYSKGATEYPTGWVPVSEGDWS